MMQYSMADRSDVFKYAFYWYR